MEFAEKHLVVALHVSILRAKIYHVETLFRQVYVAKTTYSIKCFKVLFNPTDLDLLARGINDTALQKTVVSSPTQNNRKARYINEP